MLTHVAAPRLSIKGRHDLVVNRCFSAIGVVRVFATKVIAGLESVVRGAYRFINRPFTLVLIFVPSEKITVSGSSRKLYAT